MVTEIGSDQKNRGARTPLRHLHKIVCFLKRDHDYMEEVIINDNYTESRCKCGAWLGFEWHLMGGYKRSTDLLDHLKRKRRWDES